MHWQRLPARLPVPALSSRAHAPAQPCGFRSAPAFAVCDVEFHLGQLAHVERLCRTGGSAERKRKRRLAACRPRLSNLRSSPSDVRSGKHCARRPWFWATVPAWRHCAFPESFLPITHSDESVTRKRRRQCGDTVGQSWKRQHCHIVQLREVADG